MATETKNEIAAETEPQAAQEQIPNSLNPDSINSFFIRTE